MTGTHVIAIWCQELPFVYTHTYTRILFMVHLICVR